MYSKGTHPGAPGGAEAVELRTLDIGSAHEPSVLGWSPMWGCALTVEPARESFSLSAALPPRSLSLALSK